MPDLRLSLVVPVYNESKTIRDLLSTIDAQTLQPDEVIIVDGGSQDDTAAIVRSYAATRPGLQLVAAGRAMPGKGRNTGSAAAKYPWIAYTDAGIKLEKDWLAQLVEQATQHPEAGIVYGNFAPQLSSFFEKCAAISYVPAQQPGAIRGKAIVSCLLKKEIWEKTGGFPDWRAAEDLVFMEKAEATGAAFVTAPKAMAKWQLQQSLGATFRKFDLYSKYNVWAGRQRYWHYGVARQYLLLLPFIAAGIFHSGWWFLALPAWIGARSAKRCWMHRHEFGIKTLFNPAALFLVALLLLVIDAATYTGWIKALSNRNPLQNSDPHHQPV